MSLRWDTVVISIDSYLLEVCAKIGNKFKYQHGKMSAMCMRVQLKILTHAQLCAVIMVNFVEYQTIF